jgi:hypothetical protein
MTGFAQVENLALDDAVAADAETFAEGVGDAGLALLGAGAAFEKHSTLKTTRPGGKTRGQAGPQAL